MLFSNKESLIFYKAQFLIFICKKDRSFYHCVRRQLAGYLFFKSPPASFPNPSG